jgi:hypothetical protein
MSGICPHAPIAFPAYCARNALIPTGMSPAALPHLPGDRGMILLDLHPGTAARAVNHASSSASAIGRQPRHQRQFRGRHAAYDRVFRQVCEGVGVTPLQGSRPEVWLRLRLIVGHDQHISPHTCMITHA